MKRALALLVFSVFSSSAAAQGEPSMPILFTNVHVFDGVNEQRIENANVVVTGNLISEVSAEPLAVANARIVDGGGRTLMPGLIEHHWHAMFAGATLLTILSRQDGYVNLVAAREAEATLLRGFTTVRDLGGNVFSLKAAIDEGLFPGPRIYPSGPLIGQTSGHSDFRPQNEHPLGPAAPLTIPERSGHMIIADGVPQVLMRVREALKMGASQIKIMAGGGTASHWDPIDVSQYTFDELKAAVDAAAAWNTYVAVHAYTPAAIRASIEAGVKVIEHGNLIDEESCSLFVEHGGYLTPTLSTYHAIASEGVEAGMPEELQRKVYEVLEAGGKALEMATRLGVKTVYGTDLLGSMHQYQLNEFAIRSESQSNAQVIQSATCTAAEAFQRDGEFGVVEVGARADLLAVNGNPLDDLGVMQDPDTHLHLIMKAGQVFKNAL